MISRMQKCEMELWLKTFSAISKEVRAKLLSKKVYEAGLIFRQDNF